MPVLEKDDSNKYEYDEKSYEDKFRELYTPEILLKYSNYRK